MFIIRIPKLLAADIVSLVFWGSTMSLLLWMTLSAGDSDVSEGSSDVEAAAEDDEDVVVVVVVGDLDVVLLAVTVGRLVAPGAVVEVVVGLVIFTWLGWVVDVIGRRDGFAVVVGAAVVDVEVVRMVVVLVVVVVVVVLVVVGFV